ncbi:hypothetical protein B0H16DRAFT_1482072 [Mycena metata]|uniref:Uncharacterized protein n=1 Tax=Mycena metata TaxID=1033252 RepID=A0AAD7GV87_9AGAR|nr:hypothetical protein B0H16DRAFT_1482072 [Mycena metata]
MARLDKGKQRQHRKTARDPVEVPARLLGASLGKHVPPMHPGHLARNTSFSGCQALITLWHWDDELPVQFFLPLRKPNEYFIKLIDHKEVLEAYYLYRLIPLQQAMYSKKNGWEWVDCRWTRNIAVPRARNQKALLLRRKKVTTLKKWDEFSANN